MFVWEKSGRVWNVENGVKAAQPLIDLSEEVGNWRDFGMLGFALDPVLLLNGYIYCLYVVDYHHLKYFGTQQYSSSTNEYFHDTIGRLTRYTAKASDGFHSVDYASRKDPDRRVDDDGHSDPAPVARRRDRSCSARTARCLLSCGDGASYLTVDKGGRSAAARTRVSPTGSSSPRKTSARTARSCGRLAQRQGAARRSRHGDGVPSNPSSLSRLALLLLLVKVLLHPFCSYFSLPDNLIHPYLSIRLLSLSLLPTFFLPSTSFYTSLTFPLYILSSQSLHLQKLKPYPLLPTQSPTSYLPYSPNYFTTHPQLPK
jgi:hypothetical protein